MRSLLTVICCGNDAVGYFDLVVFLADLREVLLDSVQLVEHCPDFNVAFLLTNQVQLGKCVSGAAFNG